MTLRNSISAKLLVIMVGVGIAMGIVFPFFTEYLLDLPPERVLTPLFFTMCIMAGIVVGLLNYTIFKRIIYDFLNELNDKLVGFRTKLKAASLGSIHNCRAEECYIQSYTRDAIVGNIAESFNDFINTIRSHFQTELIVNDFQEQLKAGLKLSDVAEIVIKAFAAYFGAAAGCILAYERGKFSMINGLHLELNIAKLKTESLEQIVLGDKIQLFENLPDGRFKLDIVVGQVTPDHVVFIPLRYQDQRIGVCILIGNGPFQRNFNTIESSNFINQATPFLHNSTLIHRLELIAAIDELTGLLNRRYGMKRLQEEFERSRRHAIPFSVAMVDIDDFKRLNDTYGHQCGDYVLRELARGMEDALRASDFTLRYGGEEFMVVLPGASVNDAIKAMERMRRRIESQVLPFGAYEIRYSFSCGVCSFPAPDIDGTEALISRADQALYVAKRSGKNRVLAYDASMRG